MVTIIVSPTAHERHAAMMCGFAPPRRAAGGFDPCQPAIRQGVYHGGMGMFRPAWFKDLIADPAVAVSNDHVFDASIGRLSAEPVLLAYATQTGAAETIASDTRDQLQHAGVRVQMIDFYSLDRPLLEASRQALFIVSTTYDGDPPDMAEAFHAQVMSQALGLTHLQYGLLALGDRAYDDFCGFGHRLDDWLRASGARPWFASIDVDDEDENAVQSWHDHMAALVRHAGMQASMD